MAFSIAYHQGVLARLGSMGEVISTVGEGVDKIYDYIQTYLHQDAAVS